MAEAVRAALDSAPLPDVTVDGAVLGGLALMETMIDYDRVIVVDAMLRAGGTPGAIHRLTLADLRRMAPTEHSGSPHDTSLTTALDLGRQMGMPLPDEVIIYAIEVANVSDFGEEPTPPVARAISALTTAVLEELQLG